MRMDVKELMTGDWVQNPLGGIGRVDAIRHLFSRDEHGKVEQDEYQAKVLISGTGVYSPDSFTWLGDGEALPLNLTPALLELNGFRKFNFRNIEDQHEWVLWTDTLTHVSLWTRELRDDPRDGLMIRVESPQATCCMRIDHVHQLQHFLRMVGLDIDIKVTGKETCNQ